MANLKLSNLNSKTLTSEQIYSQVFKGSRLILADERNKKKLLDIVLRIYKENGIQAYAFCLTNDRAYFIMAEHRKELLEETAWQIIRTFLAESREYLPQLTGVKPELIPVHTCIGSDPGEILEYCRGIHRLPLEKGYASRLADYWWSSMVTYLGIYDWGMLKCSPILACFAKDPEDAVVRMQFFHKKRKDENAIELTLLKNLL